MGIFDLSKPTIKKQLKKLYINILRESLDETPLYKIKKIVKKLIKNPKKRVKSKVV